MENNYYTPELSDLHIGYECKVKIGEEWEKLISPTLFNFHT